ncbi:MAG: hypothetical protein IT330_04075 [Anaerolineae bacterium]|nr:hypothetical protein [Anaerolineae bacterium]
MNHPPEESTRPRWRMVKERIRKEDGRYLIYYRFLASEEIPPPSLPTASERTAPAAPTSPTQERP